MKELLGGTDVELVPRPDWVGEIPEEEESLLGNARAKATALVRATGEAAIADDTGLFVTALGGAPGVRSARYAGEGATYADNVQKLLDSMERMVDRSAEFRTVVLVAFPNGVERWSEGVVPGVVTDAPRGEHGFGYDSVFSPLHGEGRTWAEMEPELKNSLSHRSLAMAAISRLLLLEVKG